MGDRIRAFTLEAGRVDLFISDCANCGVIFGIPATLEERRREDHRSFYCPNGHTMYFSGPTPTEKRLKEEKERAARLRTQMLAERDQARAALQEAAEAKASEVRLRWRVGNGVCPCCGRTFAPLARHVADKHPEFVHRDLDALSQRMRELLATIHRETEEQDTAVLDVDEIHLNWGTLKALVNRGLVDTVDWQHIALTEAGWPIATQAAEEVSHA